MEICQNSWDIINSQSNFQSSDGVAICLLARLAPHVSRGRILPLPLSNARPGEIEVKMISVCRSWCCSQYSILLHYLSPCRVNFCSLINTVERKKLTPVSSFLQTFSFSFSAKLAKKNWNRQDFFSLISSGNFGFV